MIFLLILLHIAQLVLSKPMVKYVYITKLSDFEKLIVINKNPLDLRVVLTIVKRKANAGQRTTAYARIIDEILFPLHHRDDLL